MCTVISVCNQKGGIGKTTTTIELCTLLGMKGFKVLAIDLDGQCNLSSYTKVDRSKSSIRDVLNADILINDAIQKTEYYDIIISTDRLGNAGKEFGDAEDVWLLKDVLDGIGYDFVIIDNAPARSPLQTMSYIASDYGIIISECDKGSLDGVIKVSDDIKRLEQRNMTHVKILGVLMSRMEKTNKHIEAYSTLEAMSVQTGIIPFKTTISKCIAVSEAKDYKVSVTEYSEKSTPALDYKEFVEEVLDRMKVGA